jgi:hypothetical protein
MHRYKWLLATYIPQAWREADQGPPVLVCCTGRDGRRRLLVGQWSGDMQQWTHDGQYLFDATHWRDLPKPPKSPLDASAAKG